MAAYGESDMAVVKDVLDHPEDLGPGEFLTGGEAWSAFRQGKIDPASFGVYGSENWGPGEIRGNAVKDLAALNKVEMLPWDTWGRMEDAYKGETGPDYDELLDTLAAACAADDPAGITTLYARNDLTVPPELSCWHPSSSFPVVDRLPDAGPVVRTSG